MRYAIYFTPAQNHPLTRAAAGWLGRDAFTGAPCAATTIDGIAAEEIEPLVAEPRRYGFHATVVAPFRLAGGFTETQLLEAFQGFCSQTEPFTIDALAVAQLGSFLALVPRDPEPALAALAANAVRHFLPLRAPLGEAEIARRDPASLSPRQASYLARYGYPYVMDEFRFHMTLTGPLAPEVCARVRPLLERAFAFAADAPLAVDALALFVEPEPGAPFAVRAFEPFHNAARRKTA